MPDCFVCGEKPNIPKRCNHCNEPVCESHALPENHGCVGLKISNGEGKRFESHFPDSADEGNTSPTADNKSGGQIRSPKPPADTPPKPRTWGESQDTESESELDERSKRINRQSRQGSQDGSPPVETKDNPPEGTNSEVDRGRRFNYFNRYVSRMNRRDFLKATMLFGAGGAVYAAYDRGKLPKVDLPSIKNVAEPPKTEKAIKKVENGHRDNHIQSVTFYESGAAELLLTPGHEIDRIGVTHHSLDLHESSFRTWSAPKYEGPLVIRLKKVIANNGPYPYNGFKIGATYSPSEKFVMGRTYIEFKVPPMWYPIG